MSHPPKMIGLTGFARTGKDALAAELGYTLLPFSTGIKTFFNPYISGHMSIRQLQQAVFEVNPELTVQEWRTFVVKVIWPFEDADLSCDAFTDNDADKKVIRPVLEYGGELVYQHVFDDYFAQVDAALAAGQRIVNTRIATLPEARAWVKRGGVIYEVRRRGVEAASAWEADNLQGLWTANLISDVFFNNAGLDAWQVFARRLLSRQAAA